jgi:hypothetical protein
MSKKKRLGEEKAAEKTMGKLKNQERKLDKAKTDKTVGQCKSKNS